MREVQIKELVRKIVRESFKHSISEARPGGYGLYMTLNKKVRDLETAQKALAKKYFEEKDEAKKAAIFQQLKKGTADLKTWRARFQKSEDEYILNLDKDAEYQGESVVNEMGVNDTHFKNILRVYDHGGSFTKKKVAAAVCKNPNANRTKIIDYLKDMDYEEILDVEDELNIGESISEGKKAFKVNPGIGKAKYSISSHDGHKKHNDGSDFWDIQIYKNKVDLEKGIKDYKSKGFVEESVNELKSIPKGNGIPGNYFKVKAKYNTFAEYEPHAKIGDTILKYSKKSPSMRAWLETGNLDDRAKQYLSKVHSIGTDGVNLTLFGKQTPASVHPSDKKELAVVVLQN